MIHTKEVIPTSLEHALLADRVLAVLQNLESHGRDPIVEEALADAAGLLRTVVEGRRYAKERAVTKTSFQAALAYGEAVRAVAHLQHPGRPTPELNDFVSALLRTTESLNAGKSVAQSEVKQLTAFFKSLREVASRKSRRPIELVSISR